MYCPSARLEGGEGEPSEIEGGLSEGGLSEG